MADAITMRMQDRGTIMHFISGRVSRAGDCGQSPLPSATRVNVLIRIVSVLEGVMLRAVMLSGEIGTGESARTRIAWRLLPFLFLLYVANYLDRTNIAYATLGMKGDLGLSDSVFGTASGIFFIGYFALQIPGALLVERWSARLLLATTLIIWGALTTLTGFVRTPLELYGARFLLGAAEAGFFPGVIVYLSHWFVYQDRAKAVARFMSAIPIAYILGGPLAGMILRVHWMLTAGLFFCYTGGYAFWFWMPTMLQRLTGWTDVQRIGWIGAIPFVAGLIGMLLLGWNSDRTRERRWHFAVPQLTAAIALSAWFLAPHSNALLIMAFTLVGFGTVAYLPSFWALPSAFLTSSAGAAAVGFINCTASIGGFFGPKIIGDLSQRTGSFHGGFIFMVACWIIASLLVLLCPRERTA